MSPDLHKRQARQAEWELSQQRIHRKRCQAAYNELHIKHDKLAGEHDALKQRCTRLEEELAAALELFGDDCTPDEMDSYVWMMRSRILLGEFDDE